MPDYHNRKGPICWKICSLLIALTNEQSKYDELAAKIEYWIEYVLREQFATVDELVEGLSVVAWDKGSCCASVGQFFKEFRDAPHRSEQAKSFIAQFCSYVLRWFSIAAVEDIWTNSPFQYHIIRGGTSGFVRVASFVGYLIKWGLLAHELVQRHLIKSLINHDNNFSFSDHCRPQDCPEAVRANAIYQLFAAAGDTLLQGLLEPEDVQVCFRIFDTKREWITGFEPAKLQVQCLLMVISYIGA